MSQSNLEKQEAKLKALNQKIKDEKNKIEQRLGKQIISQANLDYAKKLFEVSIDEQAGSL
ncbi:hypothetical protein ABMS27_15085 [Lactiplantibacillus plantarum]|uniref:hypothetical protein n=1 Tax=Lactiplantibacillus plantarum TaxID=1590 RepID=UPI0037DC1645